MREKKTGLGKVSLEETKSVIQTISGKRKQKTTSDEVMKFRSSSLVRLTTPLTEGEIDNLTKLCREIKKKRSSGGKERITNNSIIRACLNAVLPILLGEGKTKLEDVKDEEDLVRRISEIIEQNTPPK